MVVYKKISLLLNSLFLERNIVLDERGERYENG